MSDRMTYRCLKCGETLDEADVNWKRDVDTSEAWGVLVNTHVDYATCPCGSDELEEVSCPQSA